MSAGLPRTALFCLATGVLFGVVWLLLRGLRVFLGAGRALTLLLDLLFGLFCGAGAFLCALAVDSGRLRLVQLALQPLGAWAAVTALGQVTDLLPRLLRRLLDRCGAGLRQGAGRLHSILWRVRKKTQGREKNRKKTAKKRQKGLEKTRGTGL